MELYFLLSALREALTEITAFLFRTDGNILPKTISVAGLRDL